MIYDNIKNIGDYSGISPNLGKALEVVQNLENINLKPGRNDIDGNDLFIMLFDYTSISPLEAVYEAHRRYIDIQLVLKGHEYIRCYPKCEAELIQPYDENGDVELFRISDGLDLLLEPGKFALFMAEEIHAPKIIDTEPSEVRKVVVKIRV